MPQNTYYHSKSEERGHRGQKLTIARLKSSKTNAKLCNSMSMSKAFRCPCPSSFATYNLCLRVSSHFPLPLSFSHSGWFHPLCAALPRRCLTTLASSTSGVCCKPGFILSASYNGLSQLPTLSAFMQKPVLSGSLTLRRKNQRPFSS